METLTLQSGTCSLHSSHQPLDLAPGWPRGPLAPARHSAATSGQDKCRKSVEREPEPQGVDLSPVQEERTQQWAGDETEHKGKQ